jgi:hypothetical protein
MVAFKATSMETRIKIIDKLRLNDAVHVLADVWLVSLSQNNCGNISHSIKQHDEFGAELIVLEPAADWSAEGFSEEARLWVRTDLAP